MAPAWDYFELESQTVALTSLIQQYHSKNYNTGVIITATRDKTVNTNQ